MAYQRRFKVKKQLSGSQLYRPWNKYTDGDVIIGEFIGIHKDQFGNDNYKLKVLDAMFKDDSSADYMEKTLVLNSCGSLDKAMDEVDEGEVIQVEYTGTFILDKGPFAGKEAHTMQVSICEEEDGEFEGEQDGVKEDVLDL